MAESVYLTPLHNFINEYFKALGSSIRIIDEDYFQVIHQDGTIDTYTYKPRISSENRSVILLAKGSRALVDIIKKCRNESMMSQVKISYTNESVRESIGPNECCNLCPYHGMCEDKTVCCDFCSYYRICNSHFQNASFDKLGALKESIPVTLIAYIFLVTISNDFSIHLKSQIRMVIFLNYPDGEIYGDIMAKQLDNLDFQPVDNPVSIDDQVWKELNQKAQKALRQKLDPYINIFHYQSEAPLHQKVTSILSKYSDEYINNFTSLSASKLEKLQTDALAYCEREFRGFAVNCECSLENAFIIHTTADKRELIFKNQLNSVAIDAEILLNKVIIPCSQCGLDIDKGYLCFNGHIYCSSCADVCTSCKELVCQLCDEEIDTCQTCGETICMECSNSCEECESISCKDHHFFCAVCEKSLCFDCINLCSICSKPLCSEHIGSCCECGQQLCVEHQITCRICNNIVCPLHEITCSVCGISLCSNHAFHSASKMAYVCEKHLAECVTCHRKFSVSEVSVCSACNAPLCPEHTVLCNSCKKFFCSSHIHSCPICGKQYCDCTTFDLCKYCTIGYCTSCLDINGVCSGCRTLKHDIPDPNTIRLLSEHNTSWEKYKRYRMGKSGSMTIVLAQSFTNPRIAVIHPKNGVIVDRKIKLLDYLKLLSYGR